MKILSKENQRNITGAASGSGDPSKCGCDCAGNVTGPFYCIYTIQCPQVYNC